MKCFQPVVNSSAISHSSRLTAGLRLAVLASALLFTAVGCFDSENPLSEVREGRVDRRLYGTWYWKAGGESGYLHVGNVGGGRKIRIVVIDFSRTWRLKSEEYPAHGSVVDGVYYLNIHRPDEKSGRLRYMLVKYEFKDGALKYYSLDREATGRDIAAGKISGDKKDGTISAPTAELRRYLAGHQQTLFRRFMILKRVELPESPLVTEKGPRS